MTHRGPFQPRTFCDSVIVTTLIHIINELFLLTNISDGKYGYNQMEKASKIELIDGL